MQPLNIDTNSRTAATEPFNFYVASESLRQAVSESFDSHLQDSPPPTSVRSATESPHSEKPVTQQTVARESSQTPTESTGDDIESHEHRSHSTESVEEAESVSSPASENQEIESDTVPRQQQRKPHLTEEQEDQAVRTSAPNRRSSQRSNRTKSVAKSSDAKAGKENPATAEQRSTENQEATKSVAAVAEKVEAAETEREPSGKSQAASEFVVPATDSTSANVGAVPSADSSQSGELNSPSAVIDTQHEETGKNAAINVAVELVPNAVGTSSTTDNASASGGKRSRHSARAENDPRVSVSVGNALPSEQIEVNVERAATSDSDAQLEAARHLAEIAIPTESSSPTETNLTISVSPQLRFVQHLAAKPGERVAKSSPVTDLEQARLVDRVARAFRTAEGRGGLVTLRLHPPELGALRVELRVQEGVLSARMEAETPAARSVLVENVQILRDRLAEQGVRIERFDVDLLDRHPSGDSSTFEQNGPREHSDRRTWTTPGVLSEPREELVQAPPRPTVPGKLNVIV